MNSERRTKNGRPIRTQEEMANPELIDEMVESAMQDRERISQKNNAAIRLLQEWLSDESGYDEEYWPFIKNVIEENRLSERISEK